MCRVEEKGRALRCRGCRGKLRGRDRLLAEVGELRRSRKIGVWLSTVAPGFGQIFLGRWSTGLLLGILIPLSIGLVMSVWKGFTYGHAFIAASGVFVLAVAVADVILGGPSRRRAPCSRQCPAGVPIPDYLQHLADRAWDDGYALVRTRIPLVGVIGRVCPHPCEAHCLRGIDGEPIAINGCKRFLADRRREALKAGEGEELPRVVHVDGGALRVAVVGSGPAGIACAYYLSVLGASVTVYEADEFPGGRLATTIPDFRLPPYILEEELNDLRHRGVAFATSTAVGPGGTPVAALLADYDAVFLGIGAEASVGLQIPGADALSDFQELLRRAKRGVAEGVGRSVAVIGGGNAAIDVCRTALRLGAEEVHLVYRRTREEMPAREDEVEEATREGVVLHFLADPAEIRLGGGGALELVLRKMRLGEPDASGRPRPVVVPDADWVLAVDAVIPALGQKVEGSLFRDAALEGLRREPDGRLWAEPQTQRTNLPRVYAGGDAVVGAATAVEAMAQGRRAALAIYADLSPERIPVSRLVDRRLPKVFPAHRETPQTRIREEMPKLSARGRRGHCREVEEGFREAAAHREGSRCLQCHRDL